MGDQPFDITVNPTKYGFAKNGNVYSLIIKNAQLKDAGDQISKKKKERKKKKENRKEMVTSLLLPQFHPAYN